LSVVEPDGRGAIVFPYDLKSDAIIALRRGYSDGICASLVPSQWWRDTDESGEAQAVLRLGDGEWLTSHIRVRGFRFPPVTPGDLAGDLAVVEIASKLDEHRRGTAVTSTRTEVDAIARRCSDWPNKSWPDLGN
jgi:hypothetical protein